ncbi:MAG: hypothetical protein A2017_04250 [Lentisphaerae bacterium GWF2_44_16]|nr:MAG: hypothetical protein A2017_04250 [Lentisphaerae bacterium GWF2_44_16]
MSNETKKDVERNVLIIDDYFLVRENHKLIFKKIGFNVIEANNGEEAFEKIQEAGVEKISLIIVDVLMPVMDGVEFVKKAHEKFDAELPPVFVCSSASDLPLVKKMASIGIAGFMVKPVDYKLLISKLQRFFPDISYS